MNENNVLDKIKNKLIVSCQARKGWAMYGSDIMAAFAKAAEEGGASGIRATGADNIESIKKKVDLPIIGINKQWIEGYDIYITPTYESAVEILEVGIDIIALDGTLRERPNGETLLDIVIKIRKNYPQTKIMLEISTAKEAQEILFLKPDFISTTLNGYTENSKLLNLSNVELIKQIKSFCDIPVIAEGKIASTNEAIDVLRAGACAVVVGTSITRPEIITSRYVNEIAKEVKYD